MVITHRHDHPQAHIGEHPDSGGGGQPRCPHCQRDGQRDIRRDEEQQVQHRDDDQRRWPSTDALVEVLGETAPQRGAVGVHPAVGHLITVGEDDPSAVGLDRTAQRHIVHQCRPHPVPAAYRFQCRAADQEELTVGREHARVAGPGNQRHGQPGDVGQVQQRDHQPFGEAAGALPRNSRHDRRAGLAAWTADWTDLADWTDQREHPQHAVGPQSDVGVNVEQQLPAGRGAQAVQGVRLTDPAGGQLAAAHHLQARHLRPKPGKHLGGPVGGAVVVDDDLTDRAAGAVGGAHAGLDGGDLVAGRNQHADIARRDSGAGHGAAAGPEHGVDRDQAQRQQRRQRQQHRQDLSPARSRTVEQVSRRQVPARPGDGHTRAPPDRLSSRDHRPSTSPENSGSHIELAPTAWCTRIRTNGRNRSVSTRSGIRFSPIP